MEEIIEETLRPLLDLLHINTKQIEIEAEENDRYRINLDIEDPQLLIGHHGTTLMALQHLLKILLHKKAEHEFSISMDIDNYRKRQEESVLTMALERVDKVRKLSTDQKLPPMSPYFRRLVHLHLTKPEFEDITTNSEGQGAFRAIVISKT